MTVIRLEELLKTVDPASEGKVEKALKHWRSRFHAFLSGRSRLKLSRGDEQVRVQISIRPGYPVSLGPLQEIEIDEQAEHLALVRQQIECCKEDLEVLIPRVQTLPGVEEDIKDKHEAVLLGMRISKDFLEWALRQVVIKAVVKKILEIEKDTLGVYQFRGAKGEIKLFWCVIGFVAKSLGVKVEDLTAVVLVHEMAHAYTHLGYDADGIQWKGFDRVTAGLGEALAQYYTHFAAVQHRRQSPGFWRAYEALTRDQGPIYRHHLEWVDAWPPEVVRSAMLEARRQRFTDLARFEPGLEREASRLDEAGI